MLILDQKSALILYTLNNKLVREYIRSGYQEVVKVSNLQVTSIEWHDSGLLAVGDSSGLI